MESSGYSRFMMIIVCGALGFITTTAGAAEVMGRVAGEFAHTQGGAVTYTIPIRVPDAVNGLKPDVALAYHSDGGDGLAGFGWTLTGLSEIRRCALTRGTDGRVQGVRFGAQDRYCLDGQPLILVSGSYGAPDAEYRPEIHRYERVFSRGQQGTGPAWFEVRHPNGETRRYGNDEDSRMEATGRDEVRAWAINEIEDRFQQRIGFSYLEDRDNGEHQPAEIHWSYGAGESAQMATYRLRFSYEARPEQDIRRGYLWGTRWRNSLRLATIDFEHASSPGSFARVHRYTLHYAAITKQGSQRSRLQRVVVCGASQCLPATAVQWDDPAAGWSEATTLALYTGGTLSGDFDGNGTSDLFGALGINWAVWPTAPETGQLGTPIMIPATFSPGNALITDFDGDGRADLIARPSATSNWMGYRAAQAPGTPFEPVDLELTPTGAGDIDAMDVDGDGVEDLVYLRNGTAWWRRNIGYSSYGPEMASGIGTARAPYRPVTGATGWLQHADFDGDGRADLLVARSTDTGGQLVWEGYLSTGTGFESQPYAILGSTPNPGDIVVLDHNGDGLSDVLRLAGNHWLTYVSQGGNDGNGLLLSACSSPLPGKSGQPLLPVDLRGDGREEVLLPVATGWRAHASDGTCFDGSRYETEIADPQATTASRTLTADLNGDGLLDLLVAAPSVLTPQWNRHMYLHSRREDGRHVYRNDVVRDIYDGLGQRHTFDYRVLTGWSGYRTYNGATLATTRVLLGGPYLALETWHMDAADGQRHQVGYSYGNLRVDRLGRGFLGFESVNATDSRTGLTTETTYRQDFPLAGTQLETTIKWQGAPVRRHSTTLVAAATPAPDPALDTHFVHLRIENMFTWETDAEGGYRGSLVRRLTRDLTWNYTHGAVSRDQTTVTAPQEPGASYRTLRSITLDEGLRSSAGCLGLPARVDVTREVPGTPAATRTVQYGYDPASCRKIFETEGPAGSPSEQLRTTYAWDALGRLETITLGDGAGSAAVRQTRYRYEGAAAAPASSARQITGEPDLVVHFTWDRRFGLPERRTDDAGSTSWSYDDFGRPTRETRPSGHTTTSYGACGPCYAPRARWSERQERSDGYWTETQYDAGFRVTGRSQSLAGGAVSRQIFEYDAAGHLVRESVPFRTDSARTYWRTMQYDPHNRPTIIDEPVSEATPSGAITRFVYAGLDTVRHDAAMRSSRTSHDAEGLAKSITSTLGDTTRYGHGPFGEITWIIDPAGNRREFRHDERGRLVQSTDPDSGVRHFTWNAFGEMLSQSDIQTPPNVRTWVYDQLGRVVQRTEREGTTAWNYSAVAGPARGRLQEVIATFNGKASGFRETHDYDALGRLQRTTRFVVGQPSLQTDYEWGAENKLAAMTYPVTIGLRPKFLFGYRDGHLTSIIQESVTRNLIYSLVDMDALGRETLARFGSAAIEERNIYDAASNRLVAIQSGPPDSPASLQNYAYEWDRTGNLLARRDLAQSPAREERFSYDALDRLTEARLDGTPTLSMTYGPDGNISTKSDAGQYSYGGNGAGPHAVTAISGGPAGTMSFTYDARGNMTRKPGLGISWTSYDLPGLFRWAMNFAILRYGPHRDRVLYDQQIGERSRKIYYGGPHFEIERIGALTKYRSTVFAHGRAVYTQVEKNPNGLEGYYVLHDHLGSITHLARAVGASADSLRYSFDAWGKRRNLDWTADPQNRRSSDPNWTRRGYTGHEHLDELRLIHMNGRLQDPFIGRMLSPDPVIGTLSDVQGLNAYSYAADNPTRFTDPSGLFLSSLRKTLKRAVRHVGSTGQRVVRRWGRPITAAVAAYFTAGTVSSWAYATQGTVMSGAATSSAVLGGMAGGAVAGAITTGDMRGILVGAASGGAMAGIGVQYGGAYTPGRVLAEATVGGTAAELQGGRFSDGFLTSGTLSGLSWAALEMRAAMIKQSLKNPENASGTSAGFRGDEFKLGGCRWPCTYSPLGGAQGKAGSFFRMPYAPDSFLDHLIETYAGPHDFLNKPFMYTPEGNSNGGFPGSELLNAANVLVATPFAAASVVPVSAYASLSED